MEDKKIPHNKTSPKKARQADDFTPHVNQKIRKIKQERQYGLIIKELFALEDDDYSL